MQLRMASIGGPDGPRTRGRKSVLAAAAIWAALPALAVADRVEMADGRVLEGRFVMLSGVTPPPEGASGRSDAGGTSVLMCDDELTRVFVSRRLVRSAEPAAFGSGQEVFTIDQRIPENGRRVNSLGGVLETGRFDEFGRRIIAVATDSGRVDIVQGITSVTPRWTRMQGVVTEKPVLLDMRVATSSVPFDQLLPILGRQIDRTDPDQRLRIVRFLIQAERFEEASKELSAIVADFPQLESLAAQRRLVATKSAQRILDELSLRQEAGQERMALEAFEAFPNEGIDGELVEIARERRDDIRSRIGRGRELLDEVEASVARLGEGPDRIAAAEIVAEMRREISFASLGRLAPFVRLSADGSLPPESAVAIAVSGWLEGAGAARDNLKVALSAARVRSLVREYLVTSDAPKREGILRKLTEEEAFDPPTIARLAAAMRPPVDPPEPTAPGQFRISVPGVDGRDDTTCLVQLPPEYDPLRRYPAVVTLHASFTSPEMQLDWWAGSRAIDGSRRGQASRHGYIVIAPSWTRDRQSSYEYSAREHAAVLGGLRESMRRFSIDSDRVFLSGHSAGGDAAWDVAIAHPDLWAGVVTFVPTAGRYVNHYWPNARDLPMLVVGGELDGGRLAKNAMDLDRYLQKGFDLTYVEYQGRGHENFSDEILRIFDWMKRKRRTFFPQSFETVSMRPWDRFFWWVEFAGAPARTVVLPSQWPPAANVRPLSIEAKATSANTVTVRCGAERVLVWLSPEIVDFTRPATVSVDGRRLHKGPLTPDPRTMLEDLRTRGDRQHPFWAVIDSAR